MMGEPSDFDPQTLWQSQQKEHDAMTLADIHAKARKFEARIQRRNAIEYVACGIVLVAVTPVLLNHLGWMMQGGAALIMLATLFVAWQLHRRASIEATPKLGEALTDAYRRQLIRQRDALRTVGAWYIGPMIPGMALLIAGRWFQAHTPGRSIAADHLIIAGAAVVIALVFAAIWLINLRGAKQLQQRIDEL
jgi:hypothetical protein